MTTAGEVGDDFKGGGSGATWGPPPTLTAFTPGGPESAVPTEDPLFSGPPIGEPFLMDFRCSRQYSVVRLELERKSCIDISSVPIKWEKVPFVFGVLLKKQEERYRSIPDIL